jgi:hypothetical protein
MAGHDVKGGGARSVKNPIIRSDKIGAAKEIP